MSGKLIGFFDVTNFEMILKKTEAINTIFKALLSLGTVIKLRSADCEADTKCYSTAPVISKNFNATRCFAIPSTMSSYSLYVGTFLFCGNLSYLVTAVVEIEMHSLSDFKADLSCSVLFRRHESRLDRSTDNETTSIKNFFVLESLISKKLCLENFVSLRITFIILWQPVAYEGELQYARSLPENVKYYFQSLCLQRYQTRVENELNCKARTRKYMPEPDIYFVARLRPEISIPRKT